MRRLLLSALICILCAQYSVAQEFLHIGEHAIPLSNVKKITQSVRVHPKSLSLLLEKDSTISIYVAALKATGMIDSLKFCVDDSYKILNVEDSCRWKHGYIGGVYAYVAFPEERRFNFTFFACPDSILFAKYKIKDLDGLRAKAKELYSNVYPEDAAVTDETDRRNYLNRFISYQLLNFYGSYSSLTASYDDRVLGCLGLQYGFETPEYYETMMPHSIMKISYSMGNSLSINHRHYSPQVPGVGFPYPPPVERDAVNGFYHYIDDVVAYDKNTQEVILNERMRIDFLALSPDFMTKLVDGQTVRGYGYQDKLGFAYLYFGFKPGYVRNFEFDDSTKLLLSTRHSAYADYQGDELCILGNFDVTIKLPPVPAGKYELRLGYLNAGVQPRVAFYIDGKPVDMVDLRLNGTELFDWKDDSHDPETVIDFDREMRNKGYMKGPYSYSVVGGTRLRYNSFSLRKIIGTFDTDGKTEHYLRMKCIGNNRFDALFDYIELVPATVYDNDDIIEDIY